MVMVDIQIRLGAAYFAAAASPVEQGIELGACQAIDFVVACAVRRPWPVWSHDASCGGFDRCSMSRSPCVFAAFC
jgi:hypothetical protein